MGEDTPPSAPTVEAIRNAAVEDIIKTPDSVLAIAEAAEKKCSSDSESLNKRVTTLIATVASNVLAQAQSSIADSDPMLLAHLQSFYPGFTFEVDLNEGGFITTVTSAVITSLSSSPVAPTAPDASTSTPASAPVERPTSLDVIVTDAQFQELDATERNIVTQALPLEKFKDNPAMQVALVSVLSKMTPENLQAIADAAAAFASSPTAPIENLQNAINTVATDDAQKAVLRVLAQEHREILAAPAAGPEQAPVALFSDDERKTFGAEVTRLDGLTGQGSVLQRAMGRLQLAFKGVDLAKLPNIERAEGVGKFINIIVALVELVDAIKNPTEDAGKKRAEELVNMTPEERNKKQGIDKLIDLYRDDRITPPPRLKDPDGTIYQLDTEDTSSVANGPPRFKFEGGKWSWAGSVGVEANVWREHSGGENNYSIEYGHSPSAASAKRADWNKIAGEIVGGGNTQAEKETQEAKNKESLENPKNEKILALQACLKAFNQWNDDTDQNKTVGDLTQLVVDRVFKFSKTEGDLYFSQKGYVYLAGDGRDECIVSENMKDLLVYDPVAAMRKIIDKVTNPGEKPFFGTLSKTPRDLAKHRVDLLRDKLDEINISAS